MTIRRMKGVTLIEMLLVLVIVSAVIYMLFNYVQQRAWQMRVDRTSLQMQQILNAGLSYYVGNGQWPATTGQPPYNLTANPNANSNKLQFNGYLPKGVAIASPWGGSPYFIYTDAQGKLFTVYTSITGGASGSAAGAANVVAGTLPMAYTSPSSGSPPPAGTSCTASDTTCYVVASINIPGQNLNNAGAINYAGLYKHGGCVPVPECPIDPATGTSVTPQVIIVPVSVSGLNDANSSAVYPISSFTGYATTMTALPASPPACTGSSSPPPCDTNISGKAAKSYWRACLQVVTQKGDVADTNNSTGNPALDFGANVTLMAVTRCPIKNEASGSQFTIYGN